MGIGAAGLPFLGGSTDSVPAPSSHGVVFFTPHPDDETLAGGPLLATLGFAPLVVAMTGGGASAARAKTGLSESDFIAARLREQAAAVTALGGAVDQTCPLRDGKVTCDDAYAVMLPYVQQNPGAVFATTSPNDLHPDHHACGQALRRLTNDYRIKALWCYSMASAVPARPEIVVHDGTHKTSLALAEYMHLDPKAGRYAIGARSVLSQIKAQEGALVSRCHL